MKNKIRGWQEKPIEGIANTLLHKYLDRNTAEKARATFQRRIFIQTNMEEKNYIRRLEKKVYDEIVEEK